MNEQEYKYPSKEYLYNEYIINKKSRKQIAEENGVSEATIKTHLYEKGIQKNNNKISKEVLENLYVGTNNSIAEVARILGTNDSLVSKYLDKYGIKKCNNRYAIYQYDDSNDAEWARLYNEEHMSAYAIAKIYGTTHKAVIKHLHRFGVNTRSMQVAQRVSNGNYFIHNDLLNYEIMYNLHINMRLNSNVIADLYRCSNSTIETCLKNLSIPIFNSNSAYLAPITSFPTKHNFESSLSQRMRYYCIHELNPLVLQRDNYKCLKCGATDGLHVHHAILSFNQIMYIIIDMHPELSITENIDELFQIALCDPLFLDLDNLITLCESCHYTHHKTYGY